MNLVRISALTASFFLWLGCNLGIREICGDGLDNDGDGLVDCADIECDCEDCGNGYDDDGDSDVDCDDPECEGEPECDAE